MSWPILGQLMPGQTFVVHNPRVPHRELERNVRVLDELARVPGRPDLFSRPAFPPADSGIWSCAGPLTAGRKTRRHIVPLAAHDANYADRNPLSAHGHSANWTYCYSALGHSDPNRLQEFAWYKRFMRQMRRNASRWRWES